MKRFHVTVSRRPACNPAPTSCPRPEDRTSRPAREARLAAAAALSALVLGLATGCGGGGGGDATATATAPAAAPAPTPAAPAPAALGVPAQATSVLLSSQASADALARAAEQRTRDMRLASGLAGTLLPGATPSAAPRVDVLDTRQHPLAATDYTATLCSAGSASIDVADSLLARFRDDPNAALRAGDSIAISTSRCTVRAALGLGDVSVGNFGVGAVIDGSFVLTLVSRSADSSNYLFTLAYTAFSYQPPGATAYDPLTATLQFGVNAGQQVFGLDLPGSRVLSTPNVGSTAGVTTVTGGSLRAVVAVEAGGAYADYSYTGWVYDDTTTRARSGSVAIAGANGTRATVAATASGYTVDITGTAGTARFSVVR